MNDARCEILQRVNARLADLLRRAQDSLCGKSTFSNDDAKALAALLEEMDLVIGESATLRQTVPEIAPQLDLYKLQLLQLQTTVERLQVALLARRADLETRRVGVDAASRWCISLRQTR